MRQIILAVMLVTGLAYAKPNMYIGGAFFWTGIAGNSCGSYVTQSPLDDVYVCESSPDQWGLGGEAQYQIGGSWWKGLLGLSFSRAHHRDQNNSSFGALYHNSDRQFITRSYRVIAGARLHLPQSAVYPLVPFVGGGGSLNVSERKWTYERFDSWSGSSGEEQSASSKIKPGYYVEAGLLGRLAGGGQVSLSGRIHYVDYDVIGSYEVDYDEEFSGLVMLGYVHPIN